MVEITFIERVIGEILSILPQAEIIGATTAGEIFKENVFDNSTIISITIFEKTKIKSRLLNTNDNEYEVGRNIVEELVEEDTKLIILFSDGLLSNTFNILKGIQSVNSSIVICGGKAGDNGYLKETFVFTKEGITQNGVAAVSLTGNGLNVRTDFSLGWSTIGKLMTITKASHNRIYTIDNIRAIDIYKKYLGNEVAKELPMSAIEFPLIIKEHDLEMAKVAFCCNDDGSLSFHSEVEVNDKVQFGYGNVNVLVDKSLEIANKIKNKNIEAIFVYSCSSRKSFMQDKISLEIDPINKVAPTFGFFTYGEIFTINSSHKLLNVTMTILGLSEGEENTYKDELAITKIENESQNLLEGKNFGTIKAFTNLVNQATKELQQANEILEYQKSRIEQMNIITKSILQINSEMIASGEFDRFLQMILEKVLDIVVNGKIASILLLENNRLCYKASKGYIIDKIKNKIYKLEDTYQYRTNCIDQLFNPIILRDLEKNLFPKVKQYDSWKELLSEQPQELLTCGIGIDGEVVGFINIFSTDKNVNFNEEDKSLLKYICYDIAIALKNYKLLKNILYMSRYDSLTDVYNRNYFRELLDKAQINAKLSEEVFVICMLDLNNLKVINDTYGHDAGDKILIEFTKVFKMEIGNNDILGRTGGDEFVAIFFNKNKEQVMEIIRRVCMMLKNPSLDFNKDIQEISFAYGLAEFLNDSDDINELLKIADKRMYENKRMMKTI